MAAEQPIKDRRAPVQERWHLKREVQVGHVITTLAVAASAVIYVQKIETRLALIEQSQVEQRLRDKQQDEHGASAIRDINNRLERMDGKLDRLIERRMTP